MTTFRIRFAVLLALTTSTILADGPTDNQAASVRPVPPPGIVIDSEVRSSLQKELGLLKDQIADLGKSKSAIVQRFLPDVEVFARAVELALNEDGFFEPKDTERATLVLQEGLKRASELKSEKTPWTSIGGLSMQTVRGYRSKLDGTVQPYGVVGLQTNAIQRRADIWCRGRSEKGLELQHKRTNTCRNTQFQTQE